VGIQCKLKENIMSVKKYILTIEYDTDTEEVEYISEQIVEDEDEWEYGDIYLNDYFDDEALEMISGGYIIGVS
jgi:hypothetical protein